LKNARVRENRLPRVEENYNSNIITHQIPPVNSRELGVPEVSLLWAEGKLSDRE